MYIDWLLSWISGLVINDNWRCLFWVRMNQRLVNSQNRGLSPAHRVSMMKPSHPITPPRIAQSVAYPILDVCWSPLLRNDLNAELVQWSVIAAVLPKDECRSPYLLLQPGRVSDSNWLADFGIPLYSTIPLAFAPTPLAGQG